MWTKVQGSLRSHLRTSSCPSPAPGSGLLHPAHSKSHSHNQHRHHSHKPSTMPSALQYAQPIVMNPPSGEHKSSVIFLHGLGDSGVGWSDVAYQFHAGKLKNTRFIFPNAPRRPITLNFGMSMPGWYDIASLEDINQREDEEGLKESLRFVEQLVEAEVAAGIPSTRIAVGGFSQGGAVALLALRSKTKLGAIVGMSTYLPLSKAREVVSPENMNTPVLMCHGDADQVVAYQYGRQSHAKLVSMGLDAEFVPYTNMAHSACPAELRDVEDFLAKHLNKE